MSVEYVISGQCLSDIIHRLSQGLGDFEGVLYGTEEVSLMRNVSDIESEKYKSLLFIHSIEFWPRGKLLQGEFELKAQGFMKILGWIVGRSEVPVIPSIGDKEGCSQIEKMKAEKKDLFCNGPLMFGLFTQNTINFDESIEVDPNFKPSFRFEYKFFDINTFEVVKVEIQNLHNTDSQYKTIPFTYHVSNSSFQGSNTNVRSSIDYTSQLLWEESQNLVNSIEALLPEVRKQNIELERAIQKNIQLKKQLYK